MNSSTPNTRAARDLPAVLISASAAARIREVLANEPAGTRLRVSIQGGGCSGFQYSMDLDAKTLDGDTVVERDGAAVIVDSVSLLYLTGTELDYVDDLMGAAFKLRNPNATASCSCGSSFSVA